MRDKSVVWPDVARHRLASGKPHANAYVENPRIPEGLPGNTRANSISLNNDISCDCRAARKFDFDLIVPLRIGLKLFAYL